MIARGPIAEPPRLRPPRPDAAEAEGIPHAFEVYSATTHDRRRRDHISRGPASRPASSRSRRGTYTARTSCASLDDVEAIVQLVAAFAARWNANSPSFASVAAWPGASSSARSARPSASSAAASRRSRRRSSARSRSRAALERIGVEPHEPQYVIMGQVLQGGAGQAPARQAAIGAGLPIETPADTINKVCASSIRAIEIADSMIRAGDVDVVVTGGMESMSNAPYLLKKARFGYRLGNGELIDSMVLDGLTSTFDGLHMVAAELEGRARARHLARGAGRLGGALARSARPPRRTPAASTTRSSPVGDVDGRRERSAATRRSRSSRRSSRCSTRRGRPRPATRRA